MPKQNHLVLLTNHFPFGKGESFLENELPHLIQGFATVTIITKNTTDTIRGEFPTLSIHRVSPKSTWADVFLATGQAIARMRKVLDFLSVEFREIQRLKISPPAVFRKMIHDLLSALARSARIQSIIASEKLHGELVLYSYWLDSTALATLFVATKNARIKRVSRGHGGDVYAFRHPHNYLSFRKILVSHLDAVFTISDDGNTYLKQYARSGSNGRVITSRLGTRPQQPATFDFKEPFTLVSCSFLLPVKRIHLIIDALGLMRQRINWIHIGDGPLRNELEDRAAKMAQQNPLVTYKFMGYLTNDQLLQFYKTTTVHLFVNASETEGIPVTMMEVQSFGIPVVAPAVGGIPEIVSDATGLLFNPDGAPADVAAAIGHILALDEKTYCLLRENSYQNWLTRYNADRNFPTFVANVLSLQSHEV